MFDVRDASCTVNACAVATRRNNAKELEPGMLVINQSCAWGVQISLFTSGSLFHSQVAERRYNLHSKCSKNHGTLDQQNQIADRFLSVLSWCYST
jgi:hypothetical protein